MLRGDCGRIVVGARTNIQDGTIAHATTGMSQTTIGAQCTIGHRVVLHGCAVGDNCLIGMGSLLLDGVEVGADCFVAAGSLLTPGKKFEARSFVMGAPARRIREVNADELAIIERSWRRYSQLLSSYRK